LRYFDNFFGKQLSTRLCEYKRVWNKRCSYAVKNRGENGFFEYGMIKYSIKINDIVLAAVAETKEIKEGIDFNESSKLLSKCILLKNIFTK
jgi:hypothetical protein